MRPAIDGAAIEFGAASVAGEHGDGAKAVTDRERFRVLYVDLYRDIEAFCRRRLPNDEVGDAVAEVFLVVWRRLDDVPQGHEARLWVYGVANRTVSGSDRSGRRRQRLVGRMITRWRPEPVPDPGETPAGAERLDRVLDALGALSDADQEILRLAAWERLGPAELATVLGCSPNAAKVRLHRARQRLLAASQNSPTSMKPPAGNGHVADHGADTRDEETIR